MQAQDRPRRWKERFLVAEGFVGRLEKSGLLARESRGFGLGGAGGDRREMRNAIRPDRRSNRSGRSGVEKLQGKLVSVRNPRNLAQLIPGTCRQG